MNDDTEIPKNNVLTTEMFSLIFSGKKLPHQMNIFQTHSWYGFSAMPADSHVMSRKESPDFSNVPS